MFLRWTARSLGAVGLLFSWPWPWGGRPFIPGPVEVTLYSLVALTLVSYMAAWRWEGIGGRGLTASGVLLGGFSFWATGNEMPIAMALGLPFLLAGIIFLVARKISQPAKPSGSPAENPAGIPHP